MNEISCDIRDFDAEKFLREYWQKKPLVIRQAFVDFEAPISADELAGLSCEEDVNSRIVIEKDGDHPWQPIYGPMDEEVFARMPQTHWTLLVNDVEKHLPELAWIVDRFRFIPEWRVDDLMISYAPQGGSVGPHMDLYDVFILQAQGHRRWQLNSQPVAADNQVAGTPLRIQRNFVAEQEWLLAPGDVIYIPPGVSHYGVATDDCMSYSIGFRATSHADLLNDFIAYITEDLDPSLVYRDTDLTPQAHANEITQDAIDRVTNIFNDYLKPNHPALRRWFGRYISDTKTEIVTDGGQYCDSLADLLEQCEHASLQRNPASRFAFIRNGESALLFIDGEQYSTQIRFAEQLCAEREVDLQALTPSTSNTDIALLIELFNRSKLIVFDQS